MSESERMAGRDVSFGRARSAAPTKKLLETAPAFVATWSSIRLHPVDAAL
jgi:hypothetical protein